jgi:putative transposase
MSDALIDGRKVRTLNMIDHYSRLCVGIATSHNLPAAKVIEYLERSIEQYGKSKGIRTDNGPEFTSKRFQLWLYNNSIEWIKIPKGRPDQNAIIERFNCKFL